MIGIHIMAAGLAVLSPPPLPERVPEWRDQPGISLAQRREEEPKTDIECKWDGSTTRPDESCPSGRQKLLTCSDGSKRPGECK